LKIISNVTTLCAKNNYTLGFEALKMAADEAMPNSTHAPHKNHIPGWSKEVGDKHKVARHAYLDRES